MRVDSFTKVEKLNADLLDGQSADQFVPLGGKAFNSDNLDGSDSTAFFSGGTYVRSSDAVRGDGGGQSVVTSATPCDPGDNILSAGGFTTGIEDDYMIEERPTGSFRWLVRVRDNDEPSDIGVVALCADFPPLR